MIVPIIILILLLWVLALPATYNLIRLKLAEERKYQADWSLVWMLVVFIILAVMGIFTYY